MIIIKEETRKTVADLLVKYENNIPEQISIDCIDRKIESMDFENFYEDLSHFQSIPTQHKKYRCIQELALKLQRSQWYSQIVEEEERDFIEYYRNILSTRMKYTFVTDRELQDFYLKLSIIFSLLPKRIHSNPLVGNLIASIHHSVGIEDFKNADRLINEIEDFL
jgi:hypothetical protein